MKTRYLKTISGIALLLSPLIFSSCSSPVAVAPPAYSPAAESLSTKQRAASAGLRTGDFATTRNSIHSILNAPEPARPGLGTGWGNQISSDISYGSFTRSSSKPASISSIYYNDKKGIAAMVGPQRFKSNGMQKTAGGLIEWGVKSTWGTLKNYNGYGKRYIVGRQGSNYSLVVKNLSHSSLEVILSVDGLDVMSGKSASWKARGYIIPAGETLNIKGFRTSESAVAAFKFSTVSGSYSNLRHGKTRNVGVIGLAVFTQRGVDPWKWSRPAIDTRHSASPFAEAPSIRAR